MAVQPESLEVLEKAAVPPTQARAIVQAIEIEITGAKDVLATKQELVKSRHELTEALTALRSELLVAIHEGASSQPRHLYGALLGQMALLLGLAYFFVSHLSH